MWKQLEIKKKNSEFLRYIYSTGGNYKPTLEWVIFLNWTNQTRNCLVGHSKRFSFIFFPYFTCSLRYTLYSEVRPKSTNHHSHNFNYCINTKQHTGDAQNMYDSNETRKRLHYTMARKNKMQTFTAKKVTKTHVFFLSALVLYVAVFHNNLKNLKMSSHNDNKQALRRRWSDVYCEGDCDNGYCKERGTKKEVGDNETRRWMCLDPSLVCPLSLEKKEKQKHQILGIQMRYSIARNNISKLFTDGHGWFFPHSNSVSVQDVFIKIENN